MYFSCDEIVRTAPDRLEARTSIGSRVVSAAFVLLGVGVILLGVFGLGMLPGARSMITTILMVFLTGVIGIILTFLGVVSWGWQRMTFDGRDRVLRLRRAVKVLGREIPFGNIEAVELVLDDRANSAGRIKLVLSKPAGMMLGMARSESDGKLSRDASVLADFISVPVRDARLTAVPNSQASTGEQIWVGLWACRAMGAANFQTHRLVEASQDMLVVEPTREFRAYRGIRRWLGPMVIACGFAILGFSAYAETDPIGWGWPVYAVTVCLAVGGLIIWVSARIPRCVPVFIDRTRDEIRGKKLLVAGRLVKRLPLHSVAAVQIVSFRKYDDTEFPSDTIYEINFVLDQSGGERLTLMAFSEEKQIRSYAQTLAEFLNVPLMDNSSGAETDCQ